MPPTSSRHPPEDVPQLSCDLCRERKVKCDKLDPCTNCKTAGVTCSTIYRNRLPRGRHAKSNVDAAKGAAGSSRPNSKPRAGGLAATQALNQELRERVESLEGVVQSMGKQQQQQQQQQQEPTPPGAQSATSGPSDSKLQQFMDVDTLGSTGTIPNDMTVQFAQPLPAQQPRPGTSDGNFSADAQAPFNTNYTFGSQGAIPLVSSNGPLAALGFSSSGSAAANMSQVSSLLENRVLVRRLGHVYLSQVDPIIKVLHRTSIERWLVHGEAYLQYPADHPSAQVLLAAICYLAASSLTEQQAQTILPSPKTQAVDDLCKTCEAAFQSANLLSTDDITVLQAFVLYLIARKAFDLSKSTWILVAVAVRTGETLGLHNSTDGGSFFEQQMRKRLWLTICILDYQTALSQNSEPLAKHETVRQALNQVRHVNDVDFGPSSSPVADREELTDMTFAYVLFQHQLAGRLLNFGAASGVKTEEQRQQFARDFEERALHVLRFCDPESSQLAWFTWHATQCHVAIIRVSRLRPLSQASSSSGSQSKRSNDDMELLRMTVRVLEKTQLMHTDVRGEGFRWYSTVPWPMLATAIVECVSCNDVDLVSRAWPVLEWWYRQHETLLAQRGEDPSQGKLTSIMQRASTHVAALLPAQPQQPIPAASDSSSAASTTYPTPLSMPATLAGMPAFGDAVTSATFQPNQLAAANAAFDPTSSFPVSMFDPLPWFPECQLDAFDLAAFLPGDTDMVPQDPYQVNTAIY